jgi:hypothetical protein
VERWRKRLVELLQARLLERVLNHEEGRGALESLAAQVAERKKDPYAAVNEILARSGLA